VNETKDIKDIEKVYHTMLENTKVGSLEAPGDGKKAKEMADEHNTPASADGVNDPVSPDNTGDDNVIYMKKISERLKESKEKSGKKVQREINNFETMSEDNTKNIFDKLYSTIMEGDDPFEDLGGMDAEMDDEGTLEPEGELGSDEVTLSLPRDLAESLLDTLKGQLEDSVEDEFGGEDDVEGLGLDDEFVEDAVVSKPEPSPVGDAGPAMGGNKNNKPAASGYSADGGSAETGNIKEDPEPKPLGGHGDRSHPDAGKVSSGSNRVKNPKSKALGD
jgi:hypothetical protein